MDVGDIVTLKTGGKEMTLIGFTSEKKAYCAWWGKENITLWINREDEESLQERAFDTKCLVVVKPIKNKNNSQTT